jgi:hypothetical protein
LGAHINEQHTERPNAIPIYLTVALRFCSVVTVYSSSPLRSQVHRLVHGTTDISLVDSDGGNVLDIVVKRVDGLLPGLYILVRDPCKLDIIRDKLRKPTKSDFYFSWEKVCTPQQLPLYCLVHDDVREVARIVSCLQEIAADGVFSFGMMAEFEEPIKRYGPHIYRYLFWEAGMLGQVMYLEAEAVGIRATGIGCYFDDEVHKLFGITDRTFQSMYHFTVGNPVEDTRLRTLKAYQME